MQIEFVEPWVPVGPEAEQLTRELAREVGETHVLWSRKARPIGQRIDCDDVLFEVDGEPLRYAVVHLTWRGRRENDPRWPDTRMFSTISEWIRDGMMMDHHEYVGS